MTNKSKRNLFHGITYDSKSLIKYVFQYYLGKLIVKLLRISAKKIKRPFPPRLDSGWGIIKAAN